MADFGLSRFNTPNNMATMNKVVGTINYLAPEVSNGGTFTDKADMFRYLHKYLILQCFHCAVGNTQQNNDWYVCESL